MAKVVIEVKKIKGMGGVKTAMMHNERTRETPNADPDKKSLNYHYVQRDPSQVMGRVNELLKTVDRKIQDNAVRCIEYVITASHDFFDGKKDRKYFDRAMGFLEQRHGKENIVYAVVHNDERTPHLHALVVPVLKKEKRYTHKVTKETSVKMVTALDAGHWIGGRTKCAQMQTDFAQSVADFGIERGTPFARATHQEIKAWYASMKAGVGGAEKPAIDPEWQRKLAIVEEQRKAKQELLRKQAMEQAEKKHQRSATAKEPDPTKEDTVRATIEQKQSGDHKVRVYLDAEPEVEVAGASYPAGREDEIGPWLEEEAEVAGEGLVTEQRHYHLDQEGWAELSAMGRAVGLAPPKDQTYTTQVAYAIKVWEGMEYGPGPRPEYARAGEVDDAWAIIDQAVATVEATKASQRPQEPHRGPSRGRGDGTER